MQQHPSAHTTYVFDARTSCGQCAHASDVSPASSSTATVASTACANCCSMRCSSCCCCAVSVADALLCVVEARDENSTTQLTCERVTYVHASHASNMRIHDRRSMQGINHDAIHTMRHMHCILTQYTHAYITLHHITHPITSYHHITSHIA